MKVKVFLDMDGTIIDFAQGDLERALKLMRIPEYYRGLPLIRIDLYGRLASLLSKAELHIISGIADRVDHKNYIPWEGELYQQYFNQVMNIKGQELRKYFGDEMFKSSTFIAARYSKAQNVMDALLLDNLEGIVLVDDNDRYLKEWQEAKGIVVDAKNHNWIYHLENVVDNLIGENNG